MDDAQTSLEERPWLFWLPWAIAACLAVVCVILLAQNRQLRDAKANLLQKAESLDTRLLQTEALVQSLQARAGEATNRTDAAQPQSQK